MIIKAGFRCAEMSIFVNEQERFQLFYSAPQYTDENDGFEEEVR